MVHALTEAHRVLDARGLLIDLRPAAVHRRVYVMRGDEVRLLGVKRERFAEERAAHRAVAAAVRSGLFAVTARTAFPCNRIATSFDAFRTWLQEFAALQDLPSHDALLHRVERACLEGGRRRPRVVIAAPVDLIVLGPKKTSA
jgi:hypothetical protein